MQSKVIQWYKQLLNHILIRFHGTWLLHTHIFYFVFFTSAHITQKQLLYYENRKQLLIFALYTITLLSLYCSLLVWYLFTMYIRYEYLFFVKHLLLCFPFFFFLQKQQQQQHHQLSDLCCHFVRPALWCCWKYEQALSQCYSVFFMCSS